MMGCYDIVMYYYAYFECLTRRACCAGDLRANNVLSHPIDTHSVAFPFSLPEHFDNLLPCVLGDSEACSFEVIYIRTEPCRVNSTCSISYSTMSAKTTIHLLKVINRKLYTVEVQVICANSYLINGTY